MMYLYNMPMNVIAKMDKFTRGRILAQSLKFQRSILKAMAFAIRSGRLRVAKHQHELWKQERAAYKLALSWQSN